MSKKYSIALVLYTLILLLSILLIIADGGESSGPIDFTGLLTFAGLFLAGTATVLLACYMALVYAYGRGVGAFIGTLFGILGLLMGGYWWWENAIGKHL